MEERPGPVKLTVATEAVAPASRSVLVAREETAATPSPATLVTQTAVASTTRVVASSTDLAPLRVETVDTVTAATLSVETVAMLEQYQDCVGLYTHMDFLFVAFLFVCRWDFCVKRLFDF